jgi:hypothetical protein
VHTALRRSSACIALLSGCALVACSGSDSSSGTSESDLSVLPTRVVHRMPSNCASTISVSTLPNAACSLRDPSHADPKLTLRVFADDYGVSRVHFNHVATNVRAGSLVLDCTGDRGARTSHAIDVVIDDTAQPQLPAPYKTAGKPTLAKIDAPTAATLTDAEIYARKYPPRPNAQKDASRYAAWLDLVTSGPTMIAPRVVDDPTRTHLDAASNNWSGYVLTSPPSAPIYAWIYGEWNVPPAYAESGFYTADHSSLWVGIDGWGSNDVVQDGTDQDTLTIFWIQTSSYTAWVEWFPLTSQTLTSFPVNPGDRIRAWTWLTDANGHYTSTPTRGNYYVWNQTQNVYTMTSIATPSGTTFSGHSAEWVLERPTVLGTLTNLTDYSSATLTNAVAYDLQGGSHLYGGDSTDTPHNVTMKNGTTVLSTVAPLDASSMRFTFHAHN